MSAETLGGWHITHSSCFNVGLFTACRVSRATVYSLSHLADVCPSLTLNVTCHQSTPTPAYSLYMHHIIHGDSVKKSYDATTCSSPPYHCRYSPSKITQQNTSVFIPWPNSFDSYWMKCLLK